ncbi:Ubiquitin fusion degradation protein 4 [Myotisia sp. PD_48]|nr:Ubiquitin fusion degradation protein 4 [Myotisia sp. PD_48]
MANRAVPPSLTQPGWSADKSITTHSDQEPAHSAAPSQSQRVTRSATKLAASSASGTANSTSHPTSTNPQPPQARKRKAPARRNRKSGDTEPPSSLSQPRSSKRLRVDSSSTHRPYPASSFPPTAGMSQERPAELGNEPSKPAASSSSKQKPSRNRKTSRDSGPQHASPPRRQKKRGKRESDVKMKDSDESQPERGMKEDEDLFASHSTHDHQNQMNTAEDDDTDPFRSGIFGAGNPFGLQSTLRALSGMMSGMSSRLRDILVNLRSSDDPSIQLIALQELSDLLLVSNEDNLAGQFSADPYVKELVTLMQPSETGEENPEIMLLACRCLANLMEAIRGSVSNVVHGGAVPILCQKLLDIQFIDLAEQALSTLAKISVDFPASIVRAGGLTACLTYLDFFPTSTQRTAVTTAANCCRNLPPDSFPVVRDVMPTLLHVLASSDQKVVEQGCLCVCRVVESFRHKPEKLEELIEPDMLRAVLRLLLPGTTNLIGPHIHTHFLRVLAIICKSSPRLSMELLKMNVVDTLYQILSGVSPPDDNSVLVKFDSVHIMQALIRRPRAQVYETLNVIYELLPGIPNSCRVLSDEQLRRTLDYDIIPLPPTPKAEALGEKRLKLLKKCKPEIKRFATILMPTLTDTYSSTVNLRVRQRVLLAQLKIFETLDAQIIEESLRPVPYASFLAAILSQKDHVSLVALSLQCSELLFERLGGIYQYQFHREGVITEIKRLSETPLSSDSNEPAKDKAGPSNVDPLGTEDDELRDGDPQNIPELNEYDDESHEEEGDHGEYPEDHDQDDDSESESSSAENPCLRSPGSDIQDLITNGAKAFLQFFGDDQGNELCEKAEKVLEDLRELATKIENCYLDSPASNGLKIFRELASYFHKDALESITSFELLNSGIIRVLLEVIETHRGDLQPSLNGILRFTDQIISKTDRAGADFLLAFTSSPSSKHTGDSSDMSPLGIFINKLQDLLSRTENFDVSTVNQSSFESRNTVSMLAKQLRLRLIADDDSNIPKPYKNLMVSIHAIANFKTLDDYLRPKISLSERPRTARHRVPVFNQPPGSAATTQSDCPGRENELGLPRGSDYHSPWDHPPQHSTSGTSKPPSTRVSARNRREPESTSQQSGEESLSKRTGQRGLTKQEPPPPASESEDSDEQLECEEEGHMTENDDEEDEADALDTIVDDIDDDLSDNDVLDPTAVNMEVASTGKVTARKDDGTRVFTPSQSQSTPTMKPTSSGPRSIPPAGKPPFPNRPLSSYHAAMAMPQDWHIEFSVSGRPLAHESTIYRAVHENQAHSDDHSTRNVWSMIHTIHFKRVQGPQPAEPILVAPTSSNLSATADGIEMPESLNKIPTTASILQLLRVLHALNSRLDDIIGDSNGPANAVAQPPSAFINTKLTAKLNRQLEEPLIVASGCLPSWSQDLGRHFPFLFPFETRHLFLQSTSFGYARSMVRWQGSQVADDSRRDRGRDERTFPGRLQRQKVRISRTRILDSAMKVLELYGSSPSVLEIEYFEEVGTGLGPTLEFYSIVSKEFSKKKLKLWRDSDTNDAREYVNNKNGLFPSPMSREQASQDAGKRALQHYKALGRFVARSMLDSRIIDIGFNPAFFRIGGQYSKETPSIQTVKTVDPDLASSLMLLKKFADKITTIEADDSLFAEQLEQAIEQCTIDGATLEDLGLDFTLPGYPHIQLVPNGSNVSVNTGNLNSYIEKVIDMTVGSGVQAQLEAFSSGFSQVFPYSALKSFTPHELVMLFGQVDEDWSIETLMDSIKADHGFNMDSRSVRNLLEAMSQFTVQQRRDFLQFVTGSPKLPIGGFKGLIPMFTVVCRPSEPPYISDDYLPSVMTCVNYLKLPDYSSAEVLFDKLGVAMREGQGAFHLS